MAHPMPTLHRPATGPSLLLALALALVACGDDGAEASAAPPTASGSEATTEDGGTDPAVDPRLREVTEDELDAYLSALEAISAAGEDLGVNIDAGWSRLVTNLDEHRWSDAARSLAAEHGLKAEQFSDVHYNVILALAYVVREPATKIERSLMRVQQINTGTVLAELRDAPEIPRVNRQMVRRSRERFEPIFGIAPVATEEDEAGAGDAEG